MAKSNQYICGECGCVFEAEGGVLGNLKEAGAGDFMKSVFRNPKDAWNKLNAKTVCPECGSEHVVSGDDLARVEIPDTVTTGWEWTYLDEEAGEEGEANDVEVTVEVEDTLLKQAKEWNPLKDGMAFNAMGFFQRKMEEFKEKFNPSDLMSKLKAVGKKAGSSTVYYALLLYYALMSDEVPVSKRIIVLAALGYFIAPIDFIPDFIIGGLLDDGSVLLFAVNQILPYVTDDVKEKARRKAAEWFE